MPKCHAVTEQEDELQWKMQPHRWQIERLIEIDADRTVDKRRWSDPRIETDDRRPADLAHQFLLHEAPVGVDIPAQPGQPNAADRGSPLSPGGADIRHVQLQFPESLPVSGSQDVFPIFNRSHGVVRVLALWEREHDCAERNVQARESRDRPGVSFGHGSTQIWRSQSRFAASQ